MEMKSTKSPRIGLSSRPRSSRSHNSSTSQPSTARKSPDIRPPEPQQRAEGGQLSPVSGDVDLDEMKKRMSAALALKQQQQKTASTNPEMFGSESSGGPHTSEPNLGQASATSEESLPSSKKSNESSKTVRTAFEGTHDAMRTPSYPFPRMQLKLNRGISHRSTPSHKPFTLLSPTSGTGPVPESAMAPIELTSSNTSTIAGGDGPGRSRPVEHPEYPTPDLYDTLLVLTADSGLDAWWANVCQVMTELYGAERASLAIPGDLTDLENVPWGQKATFNLYGGDSEDASILGSSASSERDPILPLRDAPQRTHVATQQSMTRPALISRHSIAGVTPETHRRGMSQRPSGPTRAFSSLAAHREGPLESTPGQERTRPPARLSSTTSTESSLRLLHASSASVSSAVRCFVHRSLHPLEAETDALLVRTGVIALFGVKTPLVLTRVHNEAEARPENLREGLTRSSEDAGNGRSRNFDDFLQPEPSPWSQSPAPSPAARPDPTESPFFTTTATVDEGAFEHDPPAYDYGVIPNQSYGAIGADASKTIIHIPLIQPLSGGLLASNLRFPVAILSFLSPINPYPANLRESLTYLIPHIASTYSLAQQYSVLESRLRGPVVTSRGAAMGLGGTFSDEGSELELVAELSEQIAAEQSRGISTTIATSGSHDWLLSSLESRTSSVIGTPFLDQLGFTSASGRSATPGRSGTEVSDSYFSVKRQKETPGKSTTVPGAPVPSVDSPDRVQRHERKPQRLNIRSSTKGPSPGQKTAGDHQIAPGPRSASLTSQSDHGDGLHQDRSDSLFRRSSFLPDVGGLAEKPLPDLISQLMLNSVPLQLFLAKPTSGDLVWTNRKFDAFRSQGEERVRDPWQNVHVDDKSGLLQGWNEALNSGSQFTHYVRVKRFNSDSDFRWFIFRASTLLASTGRLLYWIGSFMDVHEQHTKSIEANEKEASLARDAKIQALANSIPQVLFEAVEGEGIVAVNQQWQAYSGQTLEDARGLGFARQVHRDDLVKCGVLSSIERSTSQEPSFEIFTGSSTSSERAVGQVQAAASANQLGTEASILGRLISQGVLSIEKDQSEQNFYTTEVRLRSKSGEYRWFLVRLNKVESALKINSGQSSWYGTCLDIESRKALERELGEANKKLHQEMESKKKFFANMSHEIRTPLNGILGSIPWLGDSNLDVDQRRTVDTIQNSSHNLRELVDNILDVTKVEAGKMKLVYKWFHVRTLVEEIIDTISSRAIERALELNYTVDAKVPSTVKGDPFRLRQILLNLMGNAVKFTEEGEVYTHCYLRDPDPSETSVPNTIEIAFDVVDTGRGFDPVEFRRIFSQFGQVEGASSYDAGSGLGLYLSKQLVEMHGGRLSANSKLNEGSTFTFFIRVETLPPGTVSRSPPPPSRPGHSRTSVSFTSGSPRSRSESKTPTMNWIRGSLTSPDQLARSVASPEAQSPPIGLSESSSIRSQSFHLLQQSASSMLPTPESITSVVETTSANERQMLAEKAMSNIPSFKRSKSDNDGSGLAPEHIHPTMYSIVVICPAEFARAAIKQHIEQVVPHQIATNVTALKDIGAFLDLVQKADSPTFTHIVLDLPHTSDVMLFLRQMTNFTAAKIPDVIVITDHYQKRDIQDDYNALLANGRHGYLIHKPIKPAAFAMIFDPAQSRNLSKDAARSMAQVSSDDFKNTAARVRDTIGNKSYRILLVEDSDTNRKVIQRYLSKVDLVNEHATNGQECTDLVFSRPHGFYSLIICDIQMPVKNGYDACREIRQWESANGHPPLSIMALTANAMPEERAAAAHAGFTDYLTKPVNFNVLGTMMINLLDPRHPHVYLRDRPTESL